MRVFENKMLRRTLGHKESGSNVKTEKITK
jgi:hypothetical protein